MAPIGRLLRNDENPGTDVVFASRISSFLRHSSLIGADLGIRIGIFIGETQSPLRIRLHYV